ncbi:SGNH/GDSL hydrolase family protein [Ruminococcus sp. Marseille-P6503]|uniref:SGNH/GDSL hydrolase family protein n=1 Tax=Ruminococcus sp. Marseille-P6503 TaxID=2364796 RepID=UPI000F54328D|nr:SGNH/GDSL hydrolase family protein [Ruminococcus sp. Marseille-P6503]
MKKLILPLLLSAMLFTACGKADSSSEGAGSTAAAESASSEAEIQYPRSIKLMCLGDSITEGFTYRGSYRVQLADMLEENGLSQYVDFVGKKKAGDCYDGQHCGYTGYSIDAIAESVTGDVRSGISDKVDELFDAYTPDVVLLQIGTNDILSLYELDSAGDRLKNLVDSILDKLPEDGMLYLATIPYMDATDNTYISAEYFTVDAMDKYVDEYNEKVRTVVQEEKAAGRNIELADVNGVLTKDDLQDGVHPTKEGYEKLGEFWYGIVSAYVTGE